MKARHTEWLVLSCFVILSIIFYSTSHSFPPGARVFPRIISALVIMLAGIRMIVLLRHRDERQLVIENFKTVVSCVIAIVLFQACITYLGHSYFIMPIFFIIILRILSVENWAYVILTAFIFTFIAYALFSKLLGIALP